MFRVSKETTTLVTLALNGDFSLEAMSNVQLQYKKLNTEDYTTLTCTISSTDCFYRTVTFSVVWGTLGGEFYTKIEHGGNVVYEGLMYANSNPVVSGLNGIVIRN